MNEPKNTTPEKESKEPKPKRTLWEKIKAVAKDFWKAINDNDSSPVT